MGPATVVVAPVERQSIEVSQPLVASVEPVTTTIIAAEQAGLITERMFDEGQAVEKGAVLAQTDVELLKSERDAAEAARLAAAGQLEQSKASHELAQRELQRAWNLYEGKVAPEKEYYDRVTAEKVAAAVVVTHQAEAAAQKAAVDRLDIMLRKATVRSPLKGVISERNIEVGQWIEQGDPVATLVQLDPLFVRVSVPESVIPKVKVGEEASVLIDALGNHKFTGKVEQIIPTADPSTRTFTVKILLPNPESKVWPGFFARAILTNKSDKPMFLVPRDAVTTSGNEHRVMAARNGSAVPVPVTLGAGAGDKVSVTGELNDGDQVIVRGNEMLRGGEQLIVQNAPPATQPVEGK